MQIIGQDRLKNIFNSYSLDTMPRSILLTGEVGSGKHTLVNFIAEHLGIELVDISNNLTFEYLEELKLRVKPYIYLIDTSLVGQKEENTILKLLEEPMSNSYLILISVNKNLLLNTITNRCQCYKLDNYTKEQLSTICGEVSDDTFKYFKTPGKINKCKAIDISQVEQLANKMFSKIGTTNLSNILSISNKINFKDEEEKIDFDIFVDILVNTARDFAINNIDNRYYLCYNITDKLSNDRYISNINKKLLFDNYLCSLKQVLKG